VDRAESTPPACSRSAISVVPLAEVSRSDVLDLLDTCLGPAAAERSEAFWRWKHEASPFGTSPGLVAMADGQPIAVRVFLRWRWQSGDVILHAVRAVDTATHPDWRRHGLFRRLTSELLSAVENEGVAFVFNTPNPTSRAGYLSLGWRDVGRLPVWIRPRRPLRLLGALLRKPPSGATTSSELPPDVLSPLRPVGELLEQPALAGFLAAWGGGEARLHTPRDPDFLLWRYAAAPGIDYRAAWQLEGDSGAVLVARTRRRRGLVEVSLSELLVSGDASGRQAARTILGRIAALPEVDYLAAVAAYRSVERRVLAASGFVPILAGPRLVVRPLAAAPPGLAEQGSWRLSVGDLELF